MIVRVKPHRTFAWAILGLLGATILADFLVGGLMASGATWLQSTPIATWVTERFGVPFSLGEIDAFEARDYLWAAAYGTLGLGLVIHGLRDLLVPRKVLVADDEGISVHLSGWFGRTTRIPWPVIDDIRGGRLTHLDAISEALMVTVTSNEGIPSDPWGARWIDDNTLAIVARHWTKTPDAVAEGLKDLALQAKAVL